ncbi:hypothetical protein ACI3LY_000332 [Candidozyma auris]|nr:hypothetical protein QG37_01568 [[Candida] auris]GBL51087.1 hypothetical protein CAJCM15448_33610 [[Candida] auris]
MPPHLIPISVEFESPKELNDPPVIKALDEKLAARKRLEARYRNFAAYKEFRLKAEFDARGKGIEAAKIVEYEASKDAESINSASQDESMSPLISCSNKEIERKSPLPSMNVTQCSSYQLIDWASVSAAKTFLKKHLG